MGVTVNSFQVNGTGNIFVQESVMQWVLLLLANVYKYI